LKRLFAGLVTGADSSAVVTLAGRSGAAWGSVARLVTAAGRFQRNFFKADSRQGLHTFVRVSMRQFFNKKGEYQINESGFEGMRMRKIFGNKGAWICAKARRPEAEHTFQHQRGEAS